MGSGSVATGYHCNQRIEFHYSYTINTKKREYTVNWYLTTHCNDSHRSPTYYLWSGSSWCNVNGKKQSWGTSYTSNGHTVYRGFADNGSWLDNHYRNSVYHDLNGDYIGINRYVKVLGTKWASGSFTLKADNEGKAKFSASGSFTWYGATKTFNKTFHLSESALIKKCKISFNMNRGDFYNKAYNKTTATPLSIECNYGSTITIPSGKPTIVDSNYIFRRWVTDPATSFTVNSGNVSYTHSGYDYTDSSRSTHKTITVKKDITLYALWKPADRTVTVQFGSEGMYVPSSTYKQPVTKINDHSVKLVGSYGKSINLPPSVCVDIYGRHLAQYKWTKADNTVLNISVSPTSIPSFTVTSNCTLTAVYASNNYKIKLADLNDRLIRTVDTNIRYNTPIEGDFTYTPPKGYELVGWSTNKIDTLTPDITTYPSIGNVSPQYDSHVYDNTLYIGKDKYTSNYYFKYDDSNPRKYMFGNDIVLYPILKYLTSFYVYTENGWKLALPYVYDGNDWKMCLGHVYDGNDWKK